MQVPLRAGLCSAWCVCHAQWQGAYMLGLLACCLGMHVKGVPRHTLER